MPLRFQDPDVWFLVGREVRRGRLVAGLTQKELGRFVGHNQSVVAKDEAGRRSGIPEDRLRVYVETLGLDEEYLQGILDAKEFPRDEELDTIIEAVLEIPYLRDAERQAIVRFCRDVITRRRAVVDATPHLTLPVFTGPPPEYVERTKAAS